MGQPTAVGFTAFADMWPRAGVLDMEGVIVPSVSDGRIFGWSGSTGSHLHI